MFAFSPAPKARDFAADAARQFANAARCQAVGNTRGATAWRALAVYSTGRADQAGQVVNLPGGQQLIGPATAVAAALAA